MTTIFGTPQETLYMVLAIAVALLTIFLCVALIYLILVLRDASKITEKSRNIVETVNNFVVKPVHIASMVIDTVRPVVERILMSVEGKAKKRKK